MKRTLWCMFSMYLNYTPNKFPFLPLPPSSSSPVSPSLSLLVISFIFLPFLFSSLWLHYTVLSRLLTLWIKDAVFILQTEFCEEQPCGHHSNCNNSSSDIGAVLWCATLTAFSCIHLHVALKGRVCFTCTLRGGGQDGVGCNAKFFH